MEQKQSQTGPEWFFLAALFAPAALQASRPLGEKIANGLVELGQLLQQALEEQGSTSTTAEAAAQIAKHVRAASPRVEEAVVASAPAATVTRAEAPAPAPAPTVETPRPAKEASPEPKPTEPVAAVKEPAPAPKSPEAVAAPKEPAPAPKPIEVTPTAKEPTPEPKPTPAPTEFKEPAPKPDLQVGDLAARIAASTEKISEPSLDEIVAAVKSDQPLAEASKPTPAPTPAPAPVTSTAAATPPPVPKPTTKDEPSLDELVNAVKTDTPIAKAPEAPATPPVLPLAPTPKEGEDYSQALKQVEAFKQIPAAQAATPEPTAAKVVETPKPALGELEGMHWLSESKVAEKAKADESLSDLQKAWLTETGTDETSTAKATVEPEAPKVAPAPASPAAIATPAAAPSVTTTAGPAPAVAAPATPAPAPQAAPAVPSAPVKTLGEALSAYAPQPAPSAPAPAPDSGPRPGSAPTTPTPAPVASAVAPAVAPAPAPAPAPTPSTSAATPVATHPVAPSPQAAPAPQLAPAPTVQAPAPAPQAQAPAAAAPVTPPQLQIAPPTPSAPAPVPAPAVAPAPQAQSAPVAPPAVAPAPSPTPAPNHLGGPTEVATGIPPTAPAAPSQPQPGTEEWQALLTQKEPEQTQGGTEMGTWDFAEEKKRQRELQERGIGVAQPLSQEEPPIRGIDPRKPVKAGFRSRLQMKMRRPEPKAKFAPGKGQPTSPEEGEIATPPVAPPTSSSVPAVNPDNKPPVQRNRYTVPEDFDVA